MQLANQRLVVSPSDLTDYLACAHLSQLERLVALGLVERPAGDNRQADLVKEKGDLHERAHLTQLREQGRDVTTIELGDALEWERAAFDTEEAMRKGADVIYQGVFVDGSWRGIADFIERVDSPSALGDWSYEVSDTKLARHAKPAHVLQL